MAKKVYVGAQGGYIQSDKNEYIDTGVTPDENFGFEIDFIPLDAPTNSNAPAYLNSGGAGGSGTVTTQRLGLNCYKDANVSPNGELQIGNIKMDSGLTVGVRQKLSLKNCVVTYPDGSTVTVTPNSFTSPNTLYIFSAHMTSGTGSSLRRSSMVLFNLKLYDGNTLLRDFTPAYNNGEYCLYDSVTNSYFYNGFSPEANHFTGYVGPVATEVKKMYVGVSGTARKIVKGYVGDSTGVARQFFG